MSTPSITPVPPTKAPAKRYVRDQMVDALRRELMGPWHPDDPTDPSEEFPTARYVVGRLAPQDSEIDQLENDGFATGVDEDGETGEASFEPPQVLGFMPSSMGLSFVLDDTCDKIDVHINWGQYYRAEEAPEHDETEDEQWNESQRCKFIWRREPRQGVVHNLGVNKVGPLPEVKLHPKHAPTGVTVAGLSEDEVCVQGVVYEIHGQRAVSLFLVNQRPQGDPKDSEKDKQFLMQAQMEVRASDGSAAFLAKDDIELEHDGSQDPDAQLNNLLYRHAREFATGHGVAAEWDGLTDDKKSVSSIRTEFIPSFEIPKVIAADDIAGDATLDMLALSKINDASQIITALEPLVASYESWIKKAKLDAEDPAIKEHDLHREAAELQIKSCERAAARMRNGLALLKNDAKAMKAFCLANEAMADQRVHALWAKANQTSDNRTDLKDFWLEKNHKWRPFQLGFILLNLVGVAEDESDDRGLVDLLWFPTGGGKTEAYLGLAAFTLFYRRLSGDRDGMEAGAGVSVIMRYTLRLLTVQQFQRATALICACEVIRRRESDLGSEPYRIGLWVGDKTAPNRFSDAKKAIEDLKTKNYATGGSPVQLLNCPRCGEALANDRGVPIGAAYTVDEKALRIRVLCPNFRCEMSAKKSAGEGVPMVVVDDELYRTCPSIIIATVDKFARMPFEGRTQAFFGIRDRYSPTLGHLTPADGAKPGGRLCKDAKKAKRLLPPELIIQDELHLISGPLGTMVGLYETAVDFLSRVKKETGDKKVVKSKILASTATIRRAQQQVYQLYHRPLAVFPPSGITSKDSFFAREIPTHDEHGNAGDFEAGRLYVGINASGSSSKTLLVRVYAGLLHAGLDHLVDPTIAHSGDPYGTLVGYFNSMRALGGAKRLVEDDVTLRRLYYLARRDQVVFDKAKREQRYISEPQELTSRLASWQIPSLLKRMDVTFPRPVNGDKNKTYPVDVLLATNMISVGVDIDRLGLMVCTGQPKTTAEYIQATSRVGRQHPGLVVTMYNWVSPRDISHYERFKSYHAALYRYVEPISVTPFSSRALDRGLHGMFGAIQRLGQTQASEEFSANQFEPTSSWAKNTISDLSERAEALATQGDHVKRVLNEQSDSWSQLKNASVSYSKKKSSKNNDLDAAHHCLFRNLGEAKGGKWAAPNSLRDVEPTATFYLADDEESLT
jgi:hypothetical protein